jgi:type VI secretion system protein ImpB
MVDSVHDKLKRVRKPRVHITYDVETEGAAEVKELPFVIGVMGDFSGDPTEELRPLGERKFIQIDRDNFDTVMGRMSPGLRLRVENTLKGDGSEMPVDLKFRSMDDFEPGRVVEQVEPLRRLLETRNKLRDLMSKADSSEKLENLLEQILQDGDKVAALRAELGADKE